MKKSDNLDLPISTEEELTEDQVNKQMKEGKKEYQVLFNYTEYGKAIVKADSEKEAEEKLYTFLEWFGLVGLDYDCQNREYDAMNAEELKQKEGDNL